MTTTEILTGVKNWVSSKLSLKQDVINDLEAIRSGSQAGSTAVQPSDLSSYFNNASYDTNTHRINFYHGQNIVAYVDASPFIVDGMVNDVRIENGYLVIDFNTDSGKQDISIPLTDIFNPNNYYTKGETDLKFTQKQSEIDDLYARIGYYVCSTEGNVAAKTIVANDYTLGNGGSMKVKMANANTADNATLNINSTGVKALYYAGERASSINTWEAGETVEVYYDGTSYYANNVAGGSGSGDGAFDVSAKYPTSGVDGGNTYTLGGALAVLNANLSASKKKGGMSIKFIQSSDNKYVQYMYIGTSTAAADFTNTDNWEKVNLEEEISQLGQRVDENEMEVIKRIGGEKTYQRTESYIGRIIDVAFPVKAGFTLTVKLVAAGVTPTVGIRVRALRTDNQYYQLGNITAIGGSVSLLLAKDIVSVDTYNNDAYTTQTIDIEASIVTEGELLQEVGYQLVNTTVAEGGKTIPYNSYQSETTAKSSANYSITNEITVPPHSIINTNSLGFNSRISQVTTNGYIPLVEGINDPNTIVGWTNNSDTPVNVVISYFTTNGLKVVIFKDVFSEILSTIPNIENYGKLIDTTPSMNYVDGMVAEGTVRTNAFAGYMHSESPMVVNKGDVICMKEASSSYIVAALYRTDSTQSYAEHLLGGIEGSIPQTRYYIVDFDGYVSFCSGNNMSKFNFRKFTFEKGVIPEMLKDEKEYISLSFSSEQTISVEDSVYNHITKGGTKKISGNGNAVITCTLAKQAVGRCFSIAFRVPYAFQDVAKFTMNGSNINKAVSSTSTLSGKTYYAEGDHFHRCNFNARYAKLLSFTIKITSTTEWEFEISEGGVVNDDMSVIPIVVGYDIAYDYRGTFQYQGDTISIYELHKRLQLPYYVALTKDQEIVNTEVQEAIDSGLCERVFYGGGSLVDYWNKTDGTLSQQIMLGKSAKGCIGTMYVVSQSILDRNMYSGIINSGVDIIRHWFTSDSRQGEFGQLAGDNNVYYGAAMSLGNSVKSSILGFPQMWYAHGVGTPVDPDDPYASYYVNADNTIAQFELWKRMQDRGKLMVLKPSDWIAFVKANRT